MTEKDRKIIEARNALEEMVYLLMELDRDTGWFTALQVVYDARWKFEQTFKAG
jgi:hypothetical protein